MTKFKDGAIGPTLILLLICVAVTAALAAVYQTTEPIIAQRQAELAEQARSKVLPEGAADGFAALSMELPDGVLEAHAAQNGRGYVFKAVGKGYGGDVVFMVGIDSQGGITGIELLEHEETIGLGTRVGEEIYLERYYGGNDPDRVDGISGATRTSNALKSALNSAIAAFEAAKEAA